MVVSWFPSLRSEAVAQSAEWEKEECWRRLVGISIYCPGREEMLVNGVRIGCHSGVAM